MISYSGSDFTTTSLAKGGSPQSAKDGCIISAGKVLKSMFVPNIGWASQVKYLFLLQRFFRHEVVEWSCSRKCLGCCTKHSLSEIDQHQIKAIHS